MLFNRLHFLRKLRGFTLIEIMLVVAIVGILASVAYPSYMSQVRKSRRSDAVAAISRVQQAQERWRANKTIYASNTEMTAPTNPALANPPILSGLGLSATSDGGYYTVVISSNTGTSYTVTATGVSGKSQYADTGCSTLSVNVANGASAVMPTACWSK